MFHFRFMFPQRSRYVIAFGFDIPHSPSSFSNICLPFFFLTLTLLAAIINNEFDKAVKAFQKTLELNPDSVLAYVQLAMAQLRLDGFDVATATFRSAFDKLESGVYSKAEKAKYDSLLLNYYGELLVENQRIDEAIAKLDKAM